MRKFLSTYEKIGSKVCYYLCFASMAMVAVMMILMFVDSMLGLFVNYRITGSYELVQVMLLILVFSSWAYTQTVHGHIHVVMFIRMMPRVVRFICYGLTSIISCVTMAIAAYAVTFGISEKLANREATGTLLIPYWPMYVFEFLAFALLAIVLIGEAIKACYAIGNQETAEEIMKDWT